MRSVPICTAMSYLSLWNSLSDIPLAGADGWKRRPVPPARHEPGLAVTGCKRRVSSPDLHRRRALVVDDDRRVGGKDVARFAVLLFFLPVAVSALSMTSPVIRAAPPALGAAQSALAGFGLREPVRQEQSAGGEDERAGCPDSAAIDGDRQPAPRSRPLRCSSSSCHRTSDVVLIVAPPVAVCHADAPSARPACAWSLRPLRTCASVLPL